MGLPFHPYHQCYAGKATYISHHSLCAVIPMSRPIDYPLRAMVWASKDASSNSERVYLY